MKIKSYLSNLVSWLSSTEMFARASKQIPGKWQLYEYYTEPDDELIHFEEIHLKENNKYWEIDFNEEEQLSQRINISLPFNNLTGELRWIVSGIYLTFFHPENKNHNNKFRFSVTKDELRLLKKNASGKIEFFGFFKRPDLLK